MDYQPPTPAPAREHIIGEDEEEVGGNGHGGSSKDSSMPPTSNSSLPSGRPHQPQPPHRPSNNPQRPIPPKAAPHPPSRPGGGGGHPGKVPPLPLATWGAPPHSMAPPSGPVGRGGGNPAANNSKAHPKPPGKSNKANLPPLDVSLERKKSLNSSIDVSTSFKLKAKLVI